MLKVRELLRKQDEAGQDSKTPQKWGGLTVGEPRLNGLCHVLQ